MGRGMRIFDRLGKLFYVCVGVEGRMGGVEVDILRCDVSMLSSL